MLLDLGSAHVHGDGTEQRIVLRLYGRGEQLRGLERRLDAFGPGHAGRFGLYFLCDSDGGGYTRQGGISSGDDNGSHHFLRGHGYGSSDRPGGEQYDVCHYGNADGFDLRGGELYDHDGNHRGKRVYHD